ncbi:hypothetical protein GCM10027190_37500 [Spirosoma areae]
MPGLRAKVINQNGGQITIRIERCQNQAIFGEVGVAYVRSGGICGSEWGKAQITQSSYWYIDVAITATFPGGSYDLWPVIYLPKSGKKLFSNPVRVTAVNNLPSKPLNEMTQVLGFNVYANNGTHVGIDYKSDVGTSIKSVGRGRVHSYSGPSFGGFGALNPTKNGPCLWIEYRLTNGSPVYVLYGHNADTWKDNYPTLTYTVNLRSGDWVNAGQVIAKTAPFYNSGKYAPHLHLGVFKPKKGSLPSGNWGYGSVSRAEGDFIDPAVFFSSYQLASNW